MPFDIRQLNLKVETEQLGTLELVGFRLMDSDWLHKTEIKVLSARGFVVQLIYSHLVSPILSFPAIAAWDDELLTKVAAAWLKDLQKGTDEKFPEVFSFDTFRQAVYEHDAAFGRRISKLLEKTLAFTTQVNEIHKFVSFPIANIQKSNLEWLNRLTWPQVAFQPVNSLISQNNVAISKMMGDLAAIRQTAMLDGLLKGLAFQTNQVADAYATYFGEFAASLSKLALPEINIAENLRIDFVVPTAITSEFVGSVRSIIATPETPSGEEDRSTESIIQRTQWEQQEDILISYLAPLGKRFLDLWQGAWHALYSDSPDRYRQATHSARELLMQVLEHLAPNASFTKEDCAKHNIDKPSRRMRIEHILAVKSTSSVEWADKMAGALCSVHDLLAAQAHNRKDDRQFTDDAIAGQLIVLGGLLQFLLSQHRPEGV